MRRNLTVFFVLAVTQITGWGVIGILPVTASIIAAEFRTTLPVIFLGATVMLITTGLAAPFIGKGFHRFGARKVMGAGAALIGCGLVCVSLAHSVLLFLAAWSLLGLAGAMFLTTAAYVYLADFADEQARGLIATLMLVTGLAGSVFWPITAFLEQAIGWRATVQIYAGLMVALVAPLVLLGLPEVSVNRHDKKEGAGTTKKGSVFWILVAAITLNSFVTYGIEAIGIELFRRLAAEPAWAVGLASLLGVLKASGRLIDLFGGKRWDALATGLVSGAMIPAGLAALLVFGAAPWSLSVYLVFFGIGSGAFAVARATMPLVFYRRADYAAAMSTIALPMNLSNAVAAPALSGLLTIAGTASALTLLIACSSVAFFLLLCLKNLQRESIPATAEIQP